MQQYLSYFSEKESLNIRRDTTRNKKRKVTRNNENNEKRRETKVKNKRTIVKVWWLRYYDRYYRVQFDFLFDFNQLEPYQLAA